MDSVDVDQPGSPESKTDQHDHDHGRVPAHVQFQPPSQAGQASADHDQNQDQDQGQLNACTRPAAGVNATATVTGSVESAVNAANQPEPTDTTARALSPSPSTLISTCPTQSVESVESVESRVCESPSPAPDSASPSAANVRPPALPLDGLAQNLALDLAPTGKAEHKEEKGTHQEKSETNEKNEKNEQSEKKKKKENNDNKEILAESDSAKSPADLKVLRDPAQIALAPGPEPVAAAAATHPPLSSSQDHSQLVQQPSSTQPTPPINLLSLPASSSPPPLSSPSPSPHIHAGPPSPHPGPLSPSSQPAPHSSPFASVAASASFSSSFAPALPCLPTFTLPSTTFNPELELQPHHPARPTSENPYSQGQDHDHDHDHDHSHKMIFSDLYKSPKSPFSKLRHLSSSTNSTQNTQSQAQSEQELAAAELVDYGDPDLVSRDKAKQKDAVRRYLAKNIRNDWDFVWPDSDKDSDAIDRAQARAAAIRRKIIAVEQVGLLQPAETFASPLVPQTVSLAAVSAAVADAGADATGATDATECATESDSDAESVYSTISEDAINLRPRAEWTSDFSEDDRGGTYYQRMPVYVHSPFRFDSPDAVGGANAKNATPEERKAKARRDVRAEMTWNDGLACFNARRDAWTGAQTVRVKPAKPIVSASPSSPRRSLFRFHSHSKTEQAAAASTVSTPTTIASSTHSSASAAPAVSSPAAPVLPLSPVMSNSRHSQYSQQSHQTGQSRNSQQSAGLETVATTPITSDDGAEGVDAGGAALHQALSSTAPIKPTRSRATQGSSTNRYNQSHGTTQYAVETLVPVAHPLLPPSNPMRQSITPALYLSLYDKLVLSLTQPSCPINLCDMIRSCVAGWKRDNEWPMRAEPPMMHSMPTLRILPSSNNNNSSAAGRRRKEGRTQPGGPFHRMRMLSKQPSVVLPTTTTATVGAAPASAEVDEKGDHDGTGQHGIRRSLQRVLGLNGSHA